MITEESFAAIVTKVSNNEGITNEEATELIESLAELDQRGLIAGEIVQFVLHGVDEVYKHFINDVLQDLQLRDKAKAKKIAGVGAKAAAQLIATTQLYIAQRYTEFDDSEESAVDNADEGVANDEPTA
jgi:tRNA A22 N-methylase